ncbi:MAG: hypothetical protein M3Q14_00995 [bacterium]|nr:hypothetical protein [bacterium]
MEHDDKNETPKVSLRQPNPVDAEVRISHDRSESSAAPLDELKTAPAKAAQAVKTAIKDAVASTVNKVQDKIPTSTKLAIDVPESAVANLRLPLAVVSRTDISKCLRELEQVDDTFHQASLRGGPPEELPVVGRVLESLAKTNDMNVSKAEDRAKLLKFLERQKVKAPVVHMSFPVEANGQVVGQLLEWFRTEIHPNIVLQIGLQPELAAGCTLRTNSKYFDFSFRKRFEKSKEKLITALEAEA